MRKMTVLKWKEFLMAAAVVVGGFSLGGVVGATFNPDSVRSENPITTFIESFTASNAKLTNIDDVVFNIMGSDIDEETQGYLTWQFNLKKQELLSHEETVIRLGDTGYLVNLVDQLSNIPEEYRTSAVQQQIFRGAEHLVVDDEARIIWCNYTAPTGVLTEAILALN